MNYYIADTHFCHKNILRYDDRPWDSLEEMESALGMAARFRRMEAGLEDALAAVRGKEYARAERVLEDLLSLDQEENDGL